MLGNDRQHYLAGSEIKFPKELLKCSQGPGEGEGVRQARTALCP